MRFSLLTYAVFGALGVDAVVHDFAFPKVIKPGSKFNVTGHKNVGSVRYNAELSICSL